MFLEDKQLNPGVTHKLGTIDHLISWLETQAADREYDWYDYGACLIHDYYKEGCGYRKDTDYEAIFYDGSRMILEDYACVVGNSSDYHYVGATQPWTFGGALARAKELRSRRLQQS